MTTQRFTLLAAVALAATLTACSATAAEDQSITATTGTTATPSTTEIPATTAGVTSESESQEPATTSATSDSGPTSDVPGTTQSPVAGFGLTGQDLANAEAAWEAYSRYDAFYKRAVADPGANWGGELSELTGDPLIVNAQSSLTRQRQLGQVINNQLVVDLTKVSVFPEYVLFEGCFDNTRTTIVDSQGNDVKAPDAPGSYYRTPGQIEVDLVEGKWVTVIEDIPDRNISC